MGMSKMNGIEPQAYIADYSPASRWDDLMPWNWQAPLNFCILAA